MEEDASMLKDKRQRKKLQNRVAQRSYRNRIKQRVEDLEREVQHYRSQREGEGEGEGVGRPDKNPFHVGSSSVDDGPGGMGGGGGGGGGGGSGGAGGPAAAPSASGPPDHEMDATTGALGHDNDGDLVDENALFDMHLATQGMEPQFHSKAPPPPNMAFPTATGLLPSGSGPVSVSGSGAGFRLPMDYHWGHGPPMSRYSNEPPQGIYVPQRSPPQPNGTGSSIESMSEPPGPANKTMGRGAPPPPPGQGPHGRIEDRIEHVRQCAVEAGFESLDDVAGQYYTGDFSHDTSISRQQRQSRQKGLPQLLATLRRDAETWSQWEAHGYHRETIQSAGSIAREELEDWDPTSSEVYLDALRRLEKATVDDSPGAADKSGLHRAFGHLMQLLQDAAPRMWALTESLVGSVDELTHTQRSYASLSIMIILSSCRRRDHVSEEMKLAAACLSIMGSV
ncbi:uncharacterized protein F5Z01DRAFT_670929 [Emericellopsis atlantica]|uniref:BZIP domain-containing protein n=1 Tax=Emericellopsis atlantica TaxID=2614577 RepID=A0A9P8CTC9_9HYPO|nr:uncharacterized protein F5Z01DRAFT_670929 [Emericellopsis atlantica]KAG9258282.1 hypothetical protein F5Z01DRAFT_670929 [Emericellopsis atlantica]